MDHVSQLREGYQKELANLTNRQSALTQELQNVVAAIQQYKGALAALDQVQAGPPPKAAAPVNPLQPATPVSSSAAAAPASPDAAPASEAPAANSAPASPTT